MNRRKFVTQSVLVTAVAGSPACATLLGGGGKPDAERDYTRIRWGWLIADILLTGLIGVVIDFLTGAIYASKSGVEGGLVGKIDLCDEAHDRLVSLHSPRKGAKFLVAHTPSCGQCSHALANVGEGDIPSSEVCKGEGVFVAEPVSIELALLSVPTSDVPA